MAVQFYDIYRQRSLYSFTIYIDRDRCTAVNDTCDVFLWTSGWSVKIPFYAMSDGEYITTMNIKI